MGLHQFQFDVLVVVAELCLLGIYHRNVMFHASCISPVGIQLAYPTHAHCNNSAYKLPGSSYFGTVQDLRKDTRDVITRVAQKVMPHILFLGNYLIRMYETHAQYNWMFPLHVLFFHIISI